MPILVTGTGLLSCSFGVAPSPLTVLPQMQAQVMLPMGTSLDSKPAANIAPFGMCSSLANPAVAAATTAALGVLTPAPCVPATPAPWLPGTPNVLIGGAPALTDQCKLMCAFGGVIQIGLPGQMKVMT
jgi:hypothetical protein